MENKNTDELGYVGGDTVNFKTVLGKLRQKTGEIAQASKKIASDVGDVIKNSVKEPQSVMPAEVAPDPGDSGHIVIATEPEKSKTETEEIIIDIEDMKNQIRDVVKDSVPQENLDIKELNKSLNAVYESLENVKVRLQSIQVATENGMRDNTAAISSLKKTVNDLKERVAEILQTINGVSKLSDSVFDLKNAQINMKKSIDTLELSVKALKKKLSASVAILSIIGVLIVALQVIAILS